MSSRPCVVLTREPGDNLPLARALGERGVPVRELPSLQTRFLPATLPLEPVAAVAFASRRAVRGYLQAGLHRAVPQGGERPLVAAVGAATREALLAEGIEVDLVAEPSTGEALAEALHRILEPGAAVLVPRGSLAGGGLEPGLESRGRPCLPLPVYANEAPATEAIPPFDAAVVFVAAPSAAKRVLARAPWLRSRPFLAIGPTTADALRRLGVQRVLGPAMTFARQLEILEDTWRAHTNLPSPSLASNDRTSLE